MANEITTDNINTLAPAVASVADGDYIYVFKAGASGFSRIEANLLFQALGGGGGLDTETNDTSDLEFADENGNVLLRIADGHIQTANFDSREPGSSTPVDLANYYTKSQVYTKSEVDSRIAAAGGGGGTTPASPLKILVLGNSFSCDAFSYFPFILKDNYGINVELGIFYKGGATTANYVSHYTEIDSGIYYSINTASQSAWSISTNKTPQDAVKLKTWDMIVFQQGSDASFTISNYASVRELYNLVKADAAYNFILGWNINHLGVANFGTNNENWQKVLDCCKLQPATFVFPYGTAIFNLMNKYYNVGNAGYLLYNKHLQEGMPCYLAAIANVQAIFDRYYPNLSVLGNTFVPNTSQRLDGGLQAHGSIITMDAEQRYMCQCSAILANKDKFNVNEIS